MRITAELLRKKAEHNEGKLADLEEIALHQLDIERIENLDLLCRHLQILLLQNNQIEKIENLYKLKELNYLNLALNNISLIENLERCESLSKIDLTCNFIGCDNLFQSLLNLKKCQSIREVYFIGNPFTDFSGHRELTIALVPQLIAIDGKEIKPAERIQAKQNFSDLKNQLQEKIEQINKDNLSKPIEERQNQYSVEARKKMYQEQKKEQENEKKKDEKKQVKKQISKYMKNGELRQCNEGKYEFKLLEQDDPQYTFFHLNLPKYMNTSLIKVEIFPFYVSIIVKDKLTQLKLWEEVFTTPDTLQRSQTTGELYIKLKKIKYDQVLARQLQQNIEQSQNKIDTQKQDESDDDIPDLEQLILQNNLTNFVIYISINNFFLINSLLQLFNFSFQITSHFLQNLLFFLFL